MGEFYGAAYIRTEDREHVRAVLERVADEKEARFLLAPAIRGWIGVYPNNSGQDVEISKAIAGRIEAEVLSVLVHDGDLFVYQFFRAGRLVDQYNSCPDYFGKVSARRRAATQGRPEALAHLLRDKHRLEELRALLSRDHVERSAFAGETLARFAELLGLPNALTSYEYLSDDETDGIEGWKKFTHIPDRSKEKAAKRAAAAAARAAKRRLRGKGLLLLEQAGERRGLNSWMQDICPDPEGNGFFVCWGHLQSTPSPLLRVAPPWPKQAEQTGLKLKSTPQSFSLSPSGRYLAVCHGTGVIQVWDLERKSVFDVGRASHGISRAAFSSDETFLVTRAGDQVTVVSMRNRVERARYSVPCQGSRNAVLHPGGNHLVVNEQTYLGILDMTSRDLKAPLYLGQQQDAVAGLGWMVSQVSGAQVEAEMKKILRHLGLKDDSRLVRQVKEQLERFKEASSTMGVPEGTSAAATLGVPEQPMNVAFNADGTLLFCATDRGIRVYAWDEVLKAQERMPKPRLGAEGRPCPHESRVGDTMPHGIVYALVHDSKANRLLFGGMGGTIEYLDLNEGGAGTLLDIPGRPTIQHLVLSRDRSALACVAISNYFEQGNKARRTLLQVWDYAALGRSSDERAPR
jgi:hypothetical protein